MEVTLLAGIGRVLIKDEEGNWHNAPIVDAIKPTKYEKNMDNDKS